MARSNRILLQFVDRLHGDESDPLGYTNYSVEQIGTREATINAGEKKISLAAKDDDELLAPWGRIQLIENDLTDELYGELCTKIASELKV